MEFGTISCLILGILIGFILGFLFCYTGYRVKMLKALASALVDFIAGDITRDEALKIINKLETKS